MTDAPAAGRVAYFDNLKYVLILLVVLGHFLDPFAKIFPAFASVFFFIYLFHMPAFVFTTGLFAARLWRADGGFKVARVPQFLLLYLILYSGIHLLELAAGKPVSFTPWSVANASWYLLACAIWYLLIPALHRIRPALLLGGLVALALLVGYLPAIGDLWSLSRVICFAPFFFLGYLLGGDRTLALVERWRGWRPLAIAGLVGAAAVVFAVPRLLRVRGILTGRNNYAVLDQYAAYGAAFRSVWFLAAGVLSACLMLLIPWGRCRLTIVGARSLQVYLWHLLALRGLALLSLVPMVRGWAGLTPWAAAVPVLLAVAAAHLFALRPPFGLIAERILRLWPGLALHLTAVPVSVVTALALLASSFLVHSGPQAIGLATGTGPKAPPPTSSPTTSTPRPTAAPAAPGAFELPLDGATGFAVVPTTLEATADHPGGVLAAGKPFVIEADEGETWIVVAGDAAGRLTAARQLVNLPDLIASIDYRTGPARFRSSGFDLPGVTGEQLTEVVAFNPRLGRAAPYLPVPLATAAKLQAAQRSALEAGDSLIVFGSFRPLRVQRLIASSLLELADRQPQVRDGIDAGGWRPSHFMALYPGGHQLGTALDLSLGRPTSPARGSEPARVEEHAMPTAVHELSREAAALAWPIRTRDGERWRDVPAAPTMTDAALRLREYCVAAGLTPAPGAWWQFDDWEAAGSAPAESIGDFDLVLPS